MYIPSRVRGRKLPRGLGLLLAPILGEDIVAGLSNSGGAIHLPSTRAAATAYTTATELVQGPTVGPETAALPTALEHLLNNEHNSRYQLYYYYYY